MKKKYSKVTVEFDNDTYNKLKEVAKYSGCTIQRVIRVLLGLYIVEHKKDAKQSN